LPYANDFSPLGCAFALKIYYLQNNLTALPFRGFRGEKEDSQKKQKTFRDLGGLL